MGSVEYMGHLLRTTSPSVGTDGLSEPRQKPRLKMSAHSPYYELEVVPIFEDTVLNVLAAFVPTA